MFKVQHIDINVGFQIRHVTLETKDLLNVTFLGNVVFPLETTTFLNKGSHFYAKLQHLREVLHSYVRYCNI